MIVCLARCALCLMILARCVFRLKMKNYLKKYGKMWSKIKVILKRKKIDSDPVFGRK